MNEKLFGIGLGIFAIFGSVAISGLGLAFTQLIIACGNQALEEIKNGKEE